MPMLTQVVMSLMATRSEEEALSLKETGVAASTVLLLVDFSADLIELCVEEGWTAGVVNHVEWVMAG